jgi:hypothetical protein
MAKLKLSERILIFLTSIIAASVLVGMTPGIPDEIIVLAIGFYGLLSDNIKL